MINTWLAICVIQCMYQLKKKVVKIGTKNIPTYLNEICHVKLLSVVNTLWSRIYSIRIQIMLAWIMIHYNYYTIDWGFVLLVLFRCFLFLHDGKSPIRNWGLGMVLEQLLWLFGKMTQLVHFKICRVMLYQSQIWLTTIRHWQSHLFRNQII